MRAINVLWTDMEGYDAACLMSFPVYLLKPTKIFFEAAHTDGMQRIGRKFATLLLLLEELSIASKYTIPPTAWRSIRPRKPGHAGNRCVRPGNAIT